MALFRRRRGPDTATRQSEGIRDFWSWWEAEGAATAASAVAARNPERMVGPLTAHVSAIEAGLVWELGLGVESAHVLVVSAEGDPALRAAARRWRLAAPEVDELWSYSDFRLPTPDAAGTVLTIGDASIDIAGATAGARVSGTHLDVAVHHPAFGALAEDERLQATYLLLDTVVGEAAVQTWFGSVTATERPSLDAVPLPGLAQVVRDLEARFTDEDGRPAWVLMHGTADDGTQIRASAQVPLRATTAPHLDTYVAVTVGFALRPLHDMPRESVLRALSDLEKHLNAILGRSGHIVAHETRAGVRVLHAYVDGATPALEQIRAAVVGWDQGRVRLESSPDPSWQRVERLRA